MKVLGIDYGEKRIGLAISDESQTLAREFGILPPKKFFREISDLITEQQVSRIVLGWPTNLSGHETKKTQEVKKFKAEIERQTGLPVYTIDERFTSVMAKHLPGGERDVDSLAAQILLQNYLDKIHSS